MKRRVLLTVSGIIPDDVDAEVESGRRPIPDYRALADETGADVIDFAGAHRAGGLVGRVLRRVAGDDMTLAWACYRIRRRYDVIVTDGEQIGLPLAALMKFARIPFRRRPDHVMIVHVISVPKKTVFLDWLGVQSHIDTFITYATSQRDFIRRRWGIADERVILSPFMVDDRFFALDQVTPADGGRALICAVGLERRDYSTLLEAVADLDVDVVIAAASPWSKRSDSTAGRSIPSNVRVERFDHFALRQLYADSAFVVMPLEDVDFQAGVTSLLETMAMERAVICTRTIGQTDVVVDGFNGRYVPPADADALRRTISELLDDPDQASRLGRNGRRRVEEAMNLDHYVALLGQVVNPAPPEGLSAVGAVPGSPVRRTGIGIVGCGFVADYYMSTLARYENLAVIGVTDLDVERMVRFAAHHAVPRYDSLDELLSDERVDIVVNLTNPRSHHAVSKASLQAGKHVYSEKPFAMELMAATALVELAEQEGLQISSAPCSLLGETAQTIWKELRRESIGTVRVAYAEMDEGLVHRMPFARWTSASGTPWPYEDEFELGTVIEHAGYVVTWLPAFFGPAVEVAGVSACLFPDKGGVATDGTDFSVVVITFSSGVMARLTCSLIAPHDHSLRIVGDDGVLSTEDTWLYGSPVLRRRSINIKTKHQWLPRRKVRLVGHPQKYNYRGTQQMDFARGVAELADAVRLGRSSRLSARYCLHANEIVLAVSHALRTSTRYMMTTSFEPVEPMPWAT